MRYLILMLTMLYSFNAYTIDFEYWEQMLSSGDDGGSYLAEVIILDEAQAMRVANETLKQLSMEPLYCLPNDIYELEMDWINLVIPVKDELNEYLAEGVTITNTLEVVLYYLMDRFPCI